MNAIKMKKPKLSNTYVHKDKGLNEPVLLNYGCHFVVLDSVVNPYHPQLHDKSDIYFFGNKQHGEIKGS